MTEYEFTELAAAAALGALDTDDAARFAQALAEHPEWQPILDQERELVALLGETVPAVTPPASLKLSLLAELDSRIAGGLLPSAMRADAAERDVSTPASASASVATAGGLPAAAAADAAPADVVSENSTPAEPARAVADAAVVPPSEADRFNATDEDDDAPYAPKRRWGVQLVASLAIVALLAGVGAGLFGVFPQSEPDSVVAIEQVIQAPDVQFATTRVDGGGEAGLSWSAKEGRAVLLTQGLPEAPSGHTYEMWWVRGDQRIPAGTFDPNQAGETAVLVHGEMHAGDSVAVTVEVTGGSADGTPSDKLVFAIETGGSAPISA